VYYFNYLKAFLNQNHKPIVSGIDTKASLCKDKKARIGPFVGLFSPVPINDKHNFRTKRRKTKLGSSNEFQVERWKMIGVQMCMDRCSSVKALYGKRKKTYF
jgi:hypothetical protein